MRDFDKFSMLLFLFLGSAFALETNDPLDGVNNVKDPIESVKQNCISGIDWSTKTCTLRTDAWEA
jgi:hypothetical protein